MTQQHRGIYDMEKYLTSLNDFRWFYPEIRGITDIDWSYERKKHFLTMEGKHLINNILKVWEGQAIYLNNLQDVLSNKSRVAVVGITPGINDTYQYIPIKEYLSKAKFIDDNGKKYWIMDTSSIIKQTQPEFKKKVLKLVETFE